jgi:hypothetical protein
MLRTGIPLRELEKMGPREWNTMRDLLDGEPTTEQIEELMEG